MGRGPSALAPGLLVAVMAAGAVGCTQTVVGSPATAPPAAAAVAGAATVRGSVAASGSVTSAVPVPTGSVPAGSVPAGSVTPDADGPTPASDRAAPEPDALEPDVLADECLLDAAQLTALLGYPMRAPEQSVVRRDDGGRGSSCYSEPVDDDSGPVVAINVYRVRAGTPAQFVRAAQGRAVTGTGAAAAVLDTAAGPTLQVGSARFLVTVAVQDREPDDAAWRAAARAALARLAR